MKLKMKLRNSGFTIIELLVTLGVIGILLAILVPNFRAPVQNSNSFAYVNSLMSALRLARSEAITRGTTVEVCAVDNTGNCVYSTTDWGSTGWKVWVPNTQENIQKFSIVDSGYISYCCGATKLQFSPIGIPTVTGAACVCPTIWTQPGIGLNAFSLFQVYGGACTNAYKILLSSSGQPTNALELICSGSTLVPPPAAAGGVNY